MKYGNPIPLVFAVQVSSRNSGVPPIGGFKQARGG